MRCTFVLERCVGGIGLVVFWLVGDVLVGCWPAGVILLWSFCGFGR